MVEAAVQVLVGLLALGGAAFGLLGAVGILRMPDLMIRMHAATKTSTLGCGLSLLAVALFYREGPIVTRALAGIAFLVATAPVSAHMIGRAAFLSGVALWPGTRVEEQAERNRSRLRRKRLATPGDRPPDR